MGDRQDVEKMSQGRQTSSHHGKRNAITDRSLYQDVKVEDMEEQSAKCNESRLSARPVIKPLTNRVKALVKAG